MSVLRMTVQGVADHNKRVREHKNATAPVSSELRLPKEDAEPAAAAPKPEYEKWLHNQLLAEGVLGMELEYLWARGRKYRADIAFPDPGIRLLVEVDGAVHRIKGRWKADILKRQEAILQSWTLLPVSTAQVRDGTACVLVKRVLAMLMAKAVPF